MKWLGNEKSSPVLPLGLCILLTVCLFTLGAVVTGKLYTGLRQLAVTDLRLSNLHGIILHLDEVLTMSARMGAETGDTQWEQRYRAHEEALDDAIAELKTIVPEAQSASSAAKTDAANKALIEMEDHAFALVRQGQREKAAQVFDAHYEEQKKLYADGMRETMAMARQRIADQLEAHHRWGALFFTAMSGVLVMLVVLWAKLFTLARRYINARLAAEAELRSIQDTLEFQVVARTQEYLVTNEQLTATMAREKETHAQLLQASKLAAVGQLAAGISHEINNPLAVILGFAQGLERRLPAGDPHRVPVAAIVRESLRCKALVQELLTFSRTAKPTVEPVNLNELVQASLVLLESRAKNQDIKLVTELCPDGAEVEVNKIQLQQVLVNLSTNAFDAMGKGGTLTLRTRREASKVVLEVADTGSGIPEAVRARIFEPFFTTKEVGKGTGLGLSLVHEIVQQHKGSIDIDSELGKGTTMRVSLDARGARRDAA